MAHLIRAKGPVTRKPRTTIEHGNSTISLLDLMNTAYVNVLITSSLSVRSVVILSETCKSFHKIRFTLIHAKLIPWAASGKLQITDIPINDDIIEYITLHVPFFRPIKLQNKYSKAITKHQRKKIRPYIKLDDEDRPEKYSDDETCDDDYDDIDTRDYCRTKEDEEDYEDDDWNYDSYE